MKKLLIVSMFANVALGAFASFIYLKQFSMVSSEQSNSTDLIKKIAILVPASHSSMEKIEEGFKVALQQKYGLNCSFDLFNANGSRPLMHAQAEEIVQQGYDLVFTIGEGATKIVKEVSTKKNKPIPVVFTAVADPVGQNLVESMQSSGNNLTGISASDNQRLQIEILKQLKPSMKKLLLVYDPTRPSRAAVRDDVQRVAQDLGIEFKTVEIYKTNEIYGKVSAFFDDVDVVLVLTDHVVVSGIDSLVKLCNRHGIMLYTSELDSVSKGAVAGFGIASEDYGSQAADLAYQILAEGKKPFDVPVLQASLFKLRINRKMMKVQNFEIDDYTQFLATSVEFV